ncbi:unnamed protein product [Linum trigynum]|uniref:Uncharacterized protein n=1 Tax=Linum trigynum TaxID=586398 RepID=A0AAV2GK12_9ROSI
MKWGGAAAPTNQSDKASINGDRSMKKLWLYLNQLYPEQQSLRNEPLPRLAAKNDRRKWIQKYLGEDGEKDFLWEETEKKGFCGRDERFGGEDG